MHVTQISDRQVFLDQAATSSVTCTLASEVVPEPKDDGTIWMVPVLRLYYTLDVNSNPFEDLSHPLALRYRWSFIETQKVVNQQASIEEHCFSCYSRTSATTSP